MDIALAPTRIDYTVDPAPVLRRSQSGSNPASLCRQTMADLATSTGQLVDALRQLKADPALIYQAAQPEVLVVRPRVFPDERLAVTGPPPTTQPNRFKMP